MIGWRAVRGYSASKKSSSLSLGILASFICYLFFFQFLGGMQGHSLFMINLGLLYTSAKLVPINKNNEEVSSLKF